MLLGIDVGNTNITFGVFDGPRLCFGFRCESSRRRTADEYVVFALRMLDLNGTDRSSIEAGVIASVVPTLTDTMVSLVRGAFHCEPIVVGPGMRSGMPILYENPREVGADRIVNAVAAYEQVRSALIVVDFGTATTFDCVNAKGEYLGGVITPGVQISAEALFSHAARLARVELAVPPKVIGRNPTHSMQSGIVFGYASLVDGMIARIKTELGPCAVIATGGLARMIAGQTRSIDRVDDDLTLHGLRLIYERNK
ncbi:MAG TPA: type III pantothenate kinase [Polyangiaceae bacterium]|nr:type III pantothenate kinase [Polyangiaceae bacterium]